MEGGAGVATDLYDVDLVIQMGDSEWRSAGVGLVI
jgi:hypothetical protein